MIALDNGDKIRGDAAVATVVDYTLHGFVGTTVTQLADGQLASAIGDLYTAGVAVGVSSIILVNTDTSARAVNLYLTPNGGTARRLIPKDLSLGVGFSLITDGKTLTVMNASGEILSTGDTGPAPTGQIFLSASGGWPSSTNGCEEPAKKEYTTNDQDFWNLAFDKDSDEFAQWTVLMPSDWDGGTITFRYVWETANGSAAETVNFALQGRSYGDNEAIDQAWGTPVAVSDTWQNNGRKHTSPESGVITLAGTPVAGELVQLRIYRDVSEDDLGGDALLLGVMITFTRS